MIMPVCVYKQFYEQIDISVDVDRGILQLYHAILFMVKVFQIYTALLWTFLYNLK
jgi:hypothetical protein